jgi:hypothetical protein
MSTVPSTLDGTSIDGCNHTDAIVVSGLHGTP